METIAFICVVIYLWATYPCITSCVLFLLFLMSNYYMERRNKSPRAAPTASLAQPETVEQTPPRFGSIQRTHADRILSDQRDTLVKTKKRVLVYNISVFMNMISCVTDYDTLLSSYSAFSKALFKNPDITTDSSVEECYYDALRNCSESMVQRYPLDLGAVSFMKITNLFRLMDYLYTVNSDYAVFITELHQNNPRLGKVSLLFRNVMGSFRESAHFTETAVPIYMEYPSSGLKRPDFVPSRVNESGVSPPISPIYGVCDEPDGQFAFSKTCKVIDFCTKCNSNEKYWDSIKYYIMTRRCGGKKMIIS